MWLRKDTGDSTHYLVLMAYGLLHRFWFVSDWLSVYAETDFHQSNVYFEFVGIVLEDSENSAVVLALRRFSSEWQMKRQLIVTKTSWTFNFSNDIN